MPARSATKCGTCGGIIYFGVDDVPPQAVICDCRDTLLTEEGPEGNSVELTQEELDAL
jgi:hypothetical protein